MDRMVEEAGEILLDNYQDRTIREGLSLIGWKPEQRPYPAAADAVEWWLYGESTGDYSRSHKKKPIFYLRMKRRRRTSSDS
jgi:hypothetical protein